MKRPRLICTVLSAAMVAACSSSPPDDGVVHDDATAAASHDADHAVGDDASVNDAAPIDGGDDGIDATTNGVPSAPTLTSARVVMHGTVRLDWTLPGAGCDQIAIQRNKDGGAYARATAVIGTAVSANDQAGHASGTYCYQLICTLGGADSAPSNERCATQ